VNTYPAKVNRVNFGPIIVIHRGARRLYLYRNTTLVRRMPIAVGMPGHATPLGRYRVIVKEKDPTWNPPDSPWAEGLGPIPPGVSNPLGTRWIGTSAPAIGIHGTPVPSSVGTAASHGCIRMYMSDVEWLFERVRVGTPVIILSA
jgi:lipoprotein-anchoring transpeptidase ErfK/SrfK